MELEEEACIKSLLSFFPSVWIGEIRGSNLKVVDRFTLSGIEQSGEGHLVLPT
jgi:hypothetical protein